MKRAKAIFFIRLDASDKIGHGHAMRCLTLANDLKKWGCRVVFVCRQMPPVLRDRLCSEGMVVSIIDYALPTSNSLFSINVSKDAKAVRDLIEASPEDKKYILIDHYGIDIAWERSVRPFVEKIFVIDDLANRNHDCDLLVDQSLNRRPEEYKSLVPDDAVVLAGTDFAILKETFQNLIPIAQSKRKKCEVVQRVLINLGGGGGFDKALVILDSIVNAFGNRFEIKVVVGGLNAEKSKKLQSVASRVNASVEVLSNVCNMHELMLDADIAIGGAGTSAWERCTLGLPSIIVEMAENQNKIAKELTLSGAARLVDIKEGGSELLAGIRYFLIRENYNKAVNRAFCVCDGMGRKRVILNILEQLIRIRPAVAEDADNLLKWRNDQITRLWSLNSSKVTKAEHLKWLTSSIENHSRQVFVVEFLSVPVGMVRVDKLDDCFELSWNMSAEYRGKGIAKVCVKMVSDSLSMPVRARIKNGNDASVRVAEFAGMEQVKLVNEVLIYEKQ